MDYKSSFGLDRVTVHNRPLVYLDNGATTWMCPAARQAIEAYETTYRANVHRGVHALSARATERYEAVRDTLTRLINAPDRNEVIYTPGTTEGINLVAFGWARRHIGDRKVALPEFEHHANIVPWQRWTAGIRPVRVTDDGAVDVDDWERALAEDQVGMGVFAHISNVLGTVQDAQRLCDIARAQGKPVLIDAAQSVARLALDVQALGCDWLAFSSHKMYGPTGAGALYGRIERLDETEPMLYGGDMIERVTLDKTTYADIPARFEAGTPNIAGMIGMGAAAEWLLTRDFDAIRAHEEALMARCLAGMAKIDGVRVLGTAMPKLSAVSFVVEDAHPMDLAGLLDFRGVAVRSGHHCAHPVHDKFGIEGSLRASFAIYTTEEDIDHFLDALTTSMEKLR